MSTLEDKLRQRQLNERKNHRANRRWIRNAVVLIAGFAAVIAATTFGLLKLISSALEALDN